MLVVLAALVCIPAAQLTGMVWLFTRGTLRDYLPTCGDWIYYWHEAATYRAVGAGGGVYGNEELGSIVSGLLANGASFTHSLFFPMLQGMFGRLAGWTGPSPIYWNLLVVSLALALYGLVVWRRLSALAWAAALLLVAPSYAVLMGAANQEATHMAVGITLAGLYLLYFRVAAGRRRRALAWGVAGFIWLVCLIRLDWVVSLLPLLFAPGPWAKSPRQWAIRLGALVLFAVSDMSVYVMFTPPYPYELFAGAAQHGLIPYIRLLQGDPSVLWHLVSENLGYLTTWGNMASSPRLLTSVALLAGTVMLFLPGVRAESSEARHRARCILLTVAANIMVLLVLVVLYYQGLSADRMLTPHVLLCVLVVVGLGGDMLPQLLLAVSLAVLPFNLAAQRDYLSSDFGYTRLQVECTLRTDIPLLQQAMPFEPGADPWCNTLLVLPYEFSSSLQALPPGIAIQYMRLDAGNEANPYPYGQHAPDYQLRSRYVMVNDADQLRFLQAHNRLEPFVRFSGGSIYLNLSRPKCPARQSAPAK